MDKSHESRVIKPGDAYNITSRQFTGLIRIIWVAKHTGATYAYKMSHRAVKRNAPTVDSQSSDFALTKLVVSAAKPISMSLEFLRSLSDDAIQLVSLQPSKQAKTAPAQLTEDQRVRHSQIKSRIENTWAEVQDYFAFGLSSYAHIINRKARIHNVHRTTLARDMSRLFLCGLDVDAAAMMSVIGSGTKPQDLQLERRVVRKLGRPKKEVAIEHNLSNPGCNVSVAGKDAVAQFLTSVKDREGLSVSSMYRTYKDQFALRPSGCLVDGLMVMSPDPERYMTYGQFAYHLKKLETAVERAVKKVGQKTFDLKHRVQLSHARHGIGFPGHTYIIDATIIDVYCVSALDRRLLIGRPVVYVVIDGFSSMIMSIHVALEGPNMEQAKVALFRAMSKKEGHFESLGLTGCSSAFAQGVRPLFVFSDRGELLSVEGGAVTSSVQIAQSIAASYRADWKSLVERYFGVQNTGVVHWIPGAVRKRMKERGDRDARLDAILTVNELTRILLNQAAKWNLTHDMSGHISCHMLRHEIDASPCSFWDYGLTHLHGSPTYLDRSSLIKNFLPALKVKATKRGVDILENLRFTASWMRDQPNYYELIDRGDNVEIYLNPDQPRGAYLLDPSTNDLQECTLVDTRGYKSMDVSLEDIRLAEDYIPLRQSDTAPTKSIVVDSLERSSRDLIATASKSTELHKQGDVRSKSKKVANIKEHRADEVSQAIGFGTISVPELRREERQDEIELKWERLLNSTEEGVQ